MHFNGKPLTINGETKSKKEWSQDERCEISYDSLINRTKNIIESSDKILKYYINRKHVKERANIKEYRIKLKEDLYRLHVIENKPVVEIAVIYHSYYTTVKRWLKEFNIPLKKENVLTIPNKGTIFGKLTFIEESNIKDQNNQPRWLCQCECGNKKAIVCYHLLTGKIKTCGCWNKETGNQNRAWQGCGNISKVYWHSVVNGARKRNLECSITIEYAWNLFVKQNGKCALSGRDIQFHHKSAYRTASFDRIDSLKGYIEGNMQWVHKQINLAKNVLKNEDFINICLDVASQHLNKYQG